MNQKHIEIIATALAIPQKYIKNVLELFAEGATVPFISRYRKEAAGGENEVQIAKIKALADKLSETDKRRESIITAIEKQELMTTDLLKKLNSTYELTELEDLYLPFKKKRKTRATKARDKGLATLAELLFRQRTIDINVAAIPFLKNGVKNVEEALQGASDIVAEQVSEDIRLRNSVRKQFEEYGYVRAKVIKKKLADAGKYSDYFEFAEKLNRIPGHRLMAIRRGETEGFLRVSISPDTAFTEEKLCRQVVKGNNQSSGFIRNAVIDSYRRLIAPSIENEFQALSKNKADQEAITVFTKNLRQLLLSAPLGEKRILALDPGFASGCKLVCLSKNGELLHNENIYPHPPRNKKNEAAKKIQQLVQSYKIEAIAIGNGTASRETEHFVRKNCYLDSDIQVFVVSENGASIYSASAVAREEFPEFDVTVRGAISIGRRLADPLAELVKIDAKSIGVGQYQHDVNQKALQKSLDATVESCVNLVGVNLNTASKHLLQYVSGLGAQLAQNIVDYRAENGAFTSRTELKKVKRLGGKAYEQCAGFMRIRDGKNPLDNTAVHPEAYWVVQKMAKDCQVKTADFIADKSLHKQVKLQNYITEKFGLPTLKDIMQELEKPGRDPREQLKIFQFSAEVRQVEDLKVGMVLPGIVTNITNFGAFVDVGVKQDGLVHVSQIKNAFVKNPADELALHQHVKVKVTSVDLKLKRIQLSMKDV